MNKKKKTKEQQAFIDGPLSMLHLNLSTKTLQQGELLYKNVGGMECYLEFIEPLALNWVVDPINDDPRKVFLYWELPTGEMKRELDLRMPRFAGIAKFRGSGKLPWMNGSPHATMEKAIEAHIEFELMHSFFHTTEDPNYTVYNYALYGNLKDNVQLAEESYEIEGEKRTTILIDNQKE